MPSYTVIYKKKYIFLILIFNPRFLIMKQNIFILAFVMSLSQLHAQNSKDSLGCRFLGSKWQKSSIGLIVGFYSESPYHPKYNPNPETKYLKFDQQVLSYNKNDFNSNDYYGGGTFINPFISFHSWNKRTNSFNKKQEMRLGIIYYSNTGREIRYNNKYYGIYPDTTFITSVTFTNLRDDLGLNMGYTVCSDEFWRRFSLYTGVNLGIAYSITHSVLQNVMESTFDSLKTNYNSSYYHNYYYNVRYSNDQYKELKGIPSISVRGSILAGMNLRIVNPVTLFTEGRIGYSYIQPIGGSASIQTHFNINVGFKFGI
jgi:hypothetical protein